MTLIAMVTFTISAQAMSYEQAREQALFLTDKMAYELNLTEDQYEAAYEVNLDYLLGVETQADLYGDYWRRRNLDLSYILLDWQYNAFCAANYFYRPLYWDAGYWHFGIYARYPYRTYFYFGRPNFWYTYRGGHAWHHNGGRSWYRGRDFGHIHRAAPDHRGFGMRNGFDRGDFKGRSGNFGRDRGRQGMNRRNGMRGNNNGMRGNNNRIGGSSRFGGHNRQGNNDNSRFGNDNRIGRNNNGTSVQRNGNRSFGNHQDGVYNRQSSTRQTVGRSQGMNSSRPSMNTSRTSRPTTSSAPTRSFNRSSSNSGPFQRSAPSSVNRSSSFGGGSHSSGSSFGGGNRGGGAHGGSAGRGGGRR